MGATDRRASYATLTGRVSVTPDAIVIVRFGNEEHVAFHRIKRIVAHDTVLYIFVEGATKPHQLHFRAKQATDRDGLVACIHDNMEANVARSPYRGR